MDREAELRKMLEDEPGDVFLQYGVALEVLKRSLADGVEALTQLLAQHPDYLPAYYQLASAQDLLGHYEQALHTAGQGRLLAQRQGDAWAERELVGLIAALSD